MQHGRAVLQAQRLEHPAAFDAAKLGVIARKDKFRAGFLGRAATRPSNSVDTIAASSTTTTVFLFHAAAPLSIGRSIRS